MTVSRQNFKRRSTEAEWMDTETVAFAEFHECLQQLAKINIFTLAYRPTLWWLKQAIAAVPAKQPIIIWDIGSGGGDMLRYIKRFAKRRGLNIELVGVDINPHAAQSAQIMTLDRAEITFETSDIFNFAPTKQADFIISSLFTHHLTDAQLVNFMRWLESHATHGWFINDLHRHPLPYYFIKLVFRALRLNRLVVHDGPISVARGFITPDWQLYLQQAGIAVTQVTVRWFFPFRYGVARWRP